MGGYLRLKFHMLISHAKNNMRRLGQVDETKQIHNFFGQFLLVSVILSLRFSFTLNL